MWSATRRSPRSCATGQSGRGSSCAPRSAAASAARVGRWRGRCRAAEASARLAVLPEYRDDPGPDARALDAAEPIPGPFTAALAEGARRLGLWVLAGSAHARGAEAAGPPRPSIGSRRASWLTARMRCAASGAAFASSPPRRAHPRAGTA
ncbi:nitrilase-related carbon-nitrogen hydrolase [Paracraurococcus lichenis]|uniref:Nitrilase-related carbon-nitrogen hydrolase n=1 Tax=Paracraurococcus lichenis TaxID=3064888 RepID=A0ABT9DUS4_9PROT|nr:nitrilase-related carbon-nitrogen hydrolase [Paracraurococcus sp. LOR1-02]MDO9707651.1 nitrilase-related carbon-nitrogen hydrolase [Paracraurococcus sp. LOR1-02]